MRAALHVVGRGQQAAAPGGNAQQIEVIAGDQISPGERTLAATSVKTEFRLRMSM
jgi:hypothetical protein